MIVRKPVLLLQQPLVDYYEDYYGSDYYQESEPLYEASSPNPFERRSFQVPEERQLFPELPDISSILLLITTIVAILGKPFEHAQK